MSRRTPTVSAASSSASAAGNWGHRHGDQFADLPFPRRIRDELIAEGRARAHHVLPESGWVTVPMDDVPALIELFRIGYDRTTAARNRA